MSDLYKPDARAFERPVAVDWDRRVESWEAVAASAAFREFATEVLAAAAPSSTDRAVDFGAGTGLLTLALAPHVEHVLAIDSSEEMLLRLQENRSHLEQANVSTRVADLRALPLDDESVSLAVSNYAFHHLDDAGKELALAEARRVLVPGGRLVVCDMMFKLSVAPRDRALIQAKVRSIAKRGPSGLVRLAKNAARVAANRWERPSRAETWEAMLTRRRFCAISVRLFEENEAGLAYAERPLQAATSWRPNRLAGEAAT